MEKSMVHELNPLVTSTVNITKSSFIHTVHQTDFNELRKSRIQNLPNYRKQDLSSKLNFVVVFQGIQIQRLSVQIETLRVKIKDYERQIGNYENYEVQIRELTQKCHSYEMQRDDHHEAMEKMNKVCQQLYNELEEMRVRYADIDLSLKEKYRLEKERSQALASQVQKWRARYNASETSKIKELQDMRMMLQNQRKSMLQRQLRQASIKHESQRSMLQNQLRKQRQVLENRNNDLKRLRFQLEQSKVMQNELKQKESRLDEYEDKLMMMAQENMRLNELLRNKKEQIQSLKNNVRNLQAKISTFKKIQQEFNEVNRKIQNYEIEIREWTQKYSRLEAQNNRNEILAQKAHEYQGLLDNSTEELERMNGIIREKMNQIEKWKAHSQKLMIQLEESKEVQSKIPQYEESIATIATQNQRLNEVLRHRLEEIQQWKSKYNQIENKMPLMEQAKQQTEEYRQKLSNEITQKTQLQQKINILEDDLSKAAQIQKLFNKERQTNQELHKQIERLNTSVKSLTSKNNDFVNKIQLMDAQLKQNFGLFQEINQCKKKIAMMTRELDRINDLLHKKIQELQQLKENYNSISSNASRYRNIEEQFVTNLKQTEQLVLKLDESRRENDCMQQKILQLEGIKKRLQGQIFSNNEEKERIMLMLQQKKREFDACFMSLEKAQEQIKRLKEFQHQYDKLRKIHRETQKKLQDNIQKYNRQIKRSEQFSNQIETLTAQVMKLKNQSNFSKQFIREFTTVKAQAQQKDKVIKSLLNRIQVIQNILRMLKQQNQQQKNNLTMQERKCMEVSSSFAEMEIFFNKFNQLQNKIQQLNVQNMELESSVRLMNVELAQSTYASQNSFKILEEQTRFSDPFAKKNDVFSPKMKLSTIDQDRQIIVQKNMQNVSPQYDNGKSERNTYYESQVRQFSSNGYPSGQSYGQPQQKYTINYQRPASNYQRSTYTVKSLRPGSQESTVTYAYSNNNEQNYLAGQYEIPGGDFTRSNLSNRPNNFMKGPDYYQQGPIKYSQSEIRQRTQQQGNKSGQQNGGRRFVMSPVRFL